MSAEQRGAMPRTHVWRGTYTNSVEAVALEPVRVLLSFLDNLGLVQWLDCHYFILIQTNS